jgi:hypothetical protein
MRAHWFRFYTAAMRDPRIDRLPPRAFRFWIQLLCVSAEYRAPGFLPDDAELADLCHVPRNHAKQWIVAFLESGVLAQDEKGVLYHPAWNPAADDDKEIEYDKPRRSDGFLPLVRPEPRILTHEDHKDIQKAITLLLGSLQTEPIGLQVGHLAQHQGIPGWRWLRAAEKLMDPGMETSKRNLKYYLGIVRNLSEADREPEKAETRAQRTYRLQAEEFAKWARSTEEPHGRS